MRQLLATTAIASVLAVMPAMAQQQEPQQPEAQQQQQMQQPEAQQQQQMQQPAPQQQVQQPAAEQLFIHQQEQTWWTANDLVGRNVYNFEGETLGSIQYVMFDEQDGQIHAVIIGAGGFLGIGRHDVGVNFQALEFRRTGHEGWGIARRDAPAEPAQPGTAPQQPDQQAQPQPVQPDQQAQQQEQQQPAQPDQQAQQPVQPDQQQMVRRDPSSHGDVEIYLNVTREQLDATPAFAWLDDAAATPAPAPAPAQPGAAPPADQPPAQQQPPADQQQPQQPQQ